MATVAPARVINELWQQKIPDTNLFALLDAARDIQIYEIIKKLEPGQYHCLFARQLIETTPELAAAAPYLVLLEKNAPFTQTIIEKGWGNAWGIFLETPNNLDTDELRTYLNQLLKLEGENGQPLYFRYYDPRVLRLYLPLFREIELFDKVIRYYLEDADPSAIITFFVVETEIAVKVTTIPQ